MHSNYVFLTARAPYRQIGTGSVIAFVVERAIGRAGVDAPSRGSHLLRHSVATRMLGEGAPLPSIGALLRHRSVETTKEYARVDSALLAQVAQPWPETMAQDTSIASSSAMDHDRLLAVAQPWPGEELSC